MAAASSYSTLLIALVIGLVSQIVAAQSKSCTCYRTSSNDYFSNYRFYDFRNVIFPSSIPRLDSALPDTADDKTGHSTEDIGTLQGGFISSNEWTRNWTIQDWGKGKSKDTKYRMWNSLSNVFIDKNNDGGADAKTKLVLRTRRFKGFQSAGEVEHLQKNLFYASTRIRARVVGDSGAVAGLFYFRNGANESAIEILTRDEPSEVRYSNQPVVDGDGNEIEGSSTLVDMNSDGKPNGTELHDRRRAVAAKDDGIMWTDWHTHRIDWVEGKSSWFVDGQHYLDKSYGVPTVPSYIIFNMWSDGGILSGEMKENNEARLEIEWVEVIYNTSDEAPSRSRSKIRRATRGGDCEVECTVDDIKEREILNGGFQVPGTIISAVPRNSTLWTGTDDKQFIIATAIGATVAVVLYIVDTTF